MSPQLVKENDKLKEHKLALKESLKSLEEIDKLFKIEINKIKNSRVTYETCISLKKEVIDLRDTLGKFNQGK